MTGSLKIGVGHYRFQQNQKYPSSWGLASQPQHTKSCPVDSLYSVSLIYKGLIIGVPVLLVCSIIFLGFSSEKPVKILDYCIYTSMIHREVIVESITLILCVQKGNLLVCYL